MTFERLFLIWEIIIGTVQTKPRQPSLISLMISSKWSQWHSQDKITWTQLPTLFSAHITCGHDTCVIPVSSSQWVSHICRLMCPPAITIESHSLTNTPSLHQPAVSHPHPSTLRWSLSAGHLPACVKPWIALSTETQSHLTLFIEIKWNKRM